MAQKFASYVNNGTDQINFVGNSYYVVGTQTAATNAWTGAMPAGLTAYYDGLTIDYYLPYAGTSTAATLNLGSLGAKPVYLSGSSTGAVTTHFAATSVLRLTYVVNSGLNSGNGCWKVNMGYNSNTWRGMQNNLTTSSSTTSDSLSAYQGYLLANGSARDNTKLPLSGGTLTGNLTISHSTDATMTADSTNPKITFTESGGKPVHLVYTDYDSYRAPAGLKIVGGSSATPAWLEVEGTVYAAGFSGPLSGNASTASKWATARTLSLSTDASGSVSFDGSANVTLAVTNTRLSTNNSTASSDPGGLTWNNLSSVSSSTVDTNDTPSSSATWWYILRNRHTNTSNNYYTDVAIPFNTNSIYYKRINGGSIQNSTINNGWVKVLDQLNYNSYAPTLTGTGASGTWGISITGSSASCTGNAVSANKVNHSLTVGSKTFDGSAAVTITASDLGLSNAMHFVGTTSTTMSDGLTTNPITVNNANYTAASGDVVLDSSSSREYVWTGSLWELLGGDSSYKVTQTAVSDPTASGNSLTFIDTISQNTNGNITATKKTVYSASTTQNGIITTGAQSIAGAKTFTGGIILSGSNINMGDAGTPSSYPFVGNKITWTGGTDGAQIYYGVDSADAGRLFLNMTDDTNALIAFAYSGTAKSYLNPSTPSFYPATTNTGSIGTSSLKWANIYATTFTGNLTGNVTGNVSGSSGSCTGNAATASKWATARTFSISSTAGTTGTSVDGSENETLIVPSTMTGFASITSTAFVGALTGNASSATKLATARTIWGQSFDGTANISGNMTGVGNINTSAAPAGTVYMSNWYRSTGATGWYSETYGGGIYMTDTTWIRTYGTKKLYVNNTTDSTNSATDDAAISTAGGIKAAKKIVAKEMKIDNNSTTLGCTLQFNTTNNCLNFVFA